MHVCIMFVENMLVHKNGLKTRNIQMQEISFPENLQYTQGFPPEKL